MTKALLRDSLRAIRKTFSRFISIVLLVMLGVLLFAGMKTVSPNMKAAGDALYKELRLADAVAQSTVGFDDEDAAAVRALPGVEAVTPARSVDGILYMSDDTPEQSMTGMAYVLRVIGYDFTQAAGSGAQRMNQLKLVQGRFPKKPDECVVSVYENTMEKDRYAIGQVIKVAGDHEDILDSLTEQFFTVVGTIYTPEFVSMELGPSRSGGSLSGYIYIPDETFKLDYYTSLFVSAQGTRGLDAYTDAYNDAVRALTEQLEQAGPALAKQRAARIEGTYQPQIDEGKRELEEGRIEGRARLDQGKKDLDRLTQAVQDGPARLRREKAAGEKQLRDARAKYDAGLKEYQAGKKQYEAGLKEYNDGLDRYNNGLAEYTQNLKKYNEAKVEVDKHPNAREEYAAGKNKLEQAKNSYDMAAMAVRAGQSALRVAKQALESGDPQRLENAFNILSGYIPMEPADKTIEGMKARVAEGELELQAMEEELKDNEKKIKDGERQLKAAEKQLKLLDEFDKAGKQLQKGKDELDKAARRLSDARTELSAARAKLDAAHEELAGAPEQIEAGRERLVREVAQGEKELADAVSLKATADAEYAAGLAEYEQKIADGERKILLAENQLAALPNAQWLVSSRDAVPGYTNYGIVADNMETFSLIFPVLLFLVAALVTFTTMTRMVEDERTQIGVLKASGYAAPAIAFKYLFYAFTAGVLGCAVGVAVGFVLIPEMIFTAYKILYLIPSMKPRFFPAEALVSLAATMVSTVGAVLIAVMFTMPKRPAELMRPKAPKAGKRVFLEWFPFIWRRLGFNGKVTVRNLMRNKTRVLMTFAGIMVCTALLLTGIGIGNSIGTMLDKQFGPDSIMRFDGQALLQADMHAGDQQVLSVFNREGIASAMPIYMKKMYAGTQAFGRQIESTVCVPENIERIGDFIDLRDEKTGRPTIISNQGCFIDGKTAELMDLKVGDYITIQNADIKVAGITHNYIYHWIYMTPKVFEEAFGVDETLYNVVILRLAPELTKLKTGSDKAIGAVKQARADLARDISDTAEVITVVYNQTTIDSVGSMLRMIRNAVAGIFIVFSGLVALVVLYNLNNINIYERIRELATIKVLGFHDKEADMFIYRENIIVTLLGLAAGLALGIPIFGFIIRAGEIESMMFVRSLAPQNFIAAASITAFFAVGVNLLMHKKIKEINMVEALKSVE